MQLYLEYSVLVLVVSILWFFPPSPVPERHHISTITLTNVYSMHLHVTDSILKDCLCDINMSIYYKQHQTSTANEIYSWGDWTDFLLFSLNHLTQPVKS